MGSDKSITDGGEVEVSRLEKSTRKAEIAAHIQPSPARRIGGRVILAIHRLIDKLLGGRLVQMQDQVINQDRELSALTRDIADLSLMVVQLNRRLEALDERLAQLEAPLEPPDES